MKIGILGGMGPFASLEVQRILLEEAVKLGANKDQDFPDIVVEMICSAPDRTAYLLNPKENSDPSPNMIRALHNLERSGCNLIFMSCNTAHGFFDLLQREKLNSETQILHIISESLKAAESQNCKKCLLLSTDATIKTGIYTQNSSSSQVEILYPEINSELQKIVMDVIYGEHGIKAGYKSEDERLSEIEMPRRKLLSVISHYEKYSIDTVILGCTELPLAIGEKGLTGLKLIDPMVITAKKILSLYHNIIC